MNNKCSEIKLHSAYDFEANIISYYFLYSQWWCIETVCPYLSCVWLLFLKMCIVVSLFWIIFYWSSFVFSFSFSSHFINIISTPFTTQKLIQFVVSKNWTCFEGIRFLKHFGVDLICLCKNFDFVWFSRLQKIKFETKLKWISRNDEKFEWKRLILVIMKLPKIMIVSVLVI